MVAWRGGLDAKIQKKASRLVHWVTLASNAHHSSPGHHKRESTIIKMYFYIAIVFHVNPTWHIPPRFVSFSLPCQILYQVNPRTQQVHFIVYHAFQLVFCVAIAAIGPNNNALPPPTRISAMNIVGDLLRKVGVSYKCMLVIPCFSFLLFLKTQVVFGALYI